MENNLNKDKKIIDLTTEFEFNNVMESEPGILNIFYSPDSIYKIKKDTIFVIHGYRDNLACGRRISYSPTNHKNIKYLGENLPNPKPNNHNFNIAKKYQPINNGFHSYFIDYRFKAVNTGKDIILFTVSRGGKTSKHIYEFEIV